MTSAVALSPENAYLAGALSEKDGFLAFGYAHAIHRLLTRDMSARDVARDKRCRHIWQVVRGVISYKRKLGKRPMTGPMVRDYAHGQLKRLLRKGENLPPANIILGVIHLAGVLEAKEVGDATFIIVNEDHDLVRTCKDIRGT